jgi:hypothetical protein
MLKAECVTSYRTFQGLYLEFCANVGRVPAPCG